VVTPDDIAGVPLFADLGDTERERLARSAADIRLVPGEYAVNAGDERALFAILEGRVETIGFVDGIERVFGGRRVGELIGEVPMALGTTFPMSFRAAEPTRVIRIEAQEYHAIAAAAPEVGVKLGALARAFGPMRCDDGAALLSDSVWHQPAGKGQAKKRRAKKS
jgi:thioredoxin reductase (NADPH)